MSVPPSFSDFKILHVYVDKAVNWDYCQKTFQIIADLKEKFNIESVALDGYDDYAYWKAVKEVWGKANLVIIQQDMVFTEKQLISILKCKHENCAFAYRIYPVTTALPFEVWSIGENLLPNQLVLFPTDVKPKFASFAATGFIKLSKETQSKVELDTPTHWKFVDLATVGKVKDLKIHVHYEVEHTHK